MGLLKVCAELQMELPKQYEVEKKTLISSHVLNKLLLFA